MPRAQGANKGPPPPSGGLVMILGVKPPSPPLHAPLNAIYLAIANQGKQQVQFKQKQNVKQKELGLYAALFWR